MLDRCIVISMLSLSANLALAAEANAEESASSADDLVEVVVTAQFYRKVESNAAAKLDIPLIETPQAVSIVNADVLKTFSITDLKSISKYISGLDARALTVGEYSDFTARGFTLDLLDGFKLNGMSFVPVQPIDTVAVERVEILKGPTGIVYGRNNYGGMLNYVTKQPTYDDFARVGFSAGYPQLSRVEADVNSTIVEDKLAVRVPISYEYRDSYTEEGSRQLTVVPALRWDISEKASVALLGLVQQWRTNRQIGVSAWALDATPDDIDWRVNNPSCVELGCVAPPASMRDVFFGSDRNYYDSTTVQALARFNYQLNDHLTYFVGGSYLDSGMTTLQYYIGTVIAGDGTAWLNGDAIDLEQKSHSFETGLTGDFELWGRTHQLYVGADHRLYRSTRDDSTEPFVGEAFNVFDFHGRDSFRNFLRGNSWDQAPVPYDYSLAVRREYSGVGAQVMFELADNLTLLVGGRYEKSEIGETATPLTDLGFSYNLSIESSRFLPRAGLTWRIVPDHWTAYASYTEGYVPQNGRTRSGAPIDPEEGHQIEVGMKGQLLDNRLLVTLAAFEIDRSGVAVADPLNVPGEIFVVGGLGQKNRGVEFEALGQIARGFNVIVAASTIEGKYDRSTNVFFSGNDISSTPDYKVAGYVNYEFQNGPLSGLSLGGGVTRVGPQWGADPETYRIEGYTTADLNTGYVVNERTSLRLQIQNLFDETYFLPRGTAWAGCCGAFGDERTYRASIEFSLE
jgi:TonB-dependent siderophore receptor